MNSHTLPKNTKFETIYKRALEAFNNDKDKALSWYMTKMPSLNNLSPYEAAKAGKTRTVLNMLDKFVISL